jgi:pectate lyase
MINCSQEYDNYAVHIKNNYFESLYDIHIDSEKLADTLSVNNVVETIITQGRHSFSTKTASGLFLQTDLHITGENQNIKLTINENGKLIKE